MTPWVKTAATGHEGLSLIMEIYVTEMNNRLLQTVLFHYFCVCTHAHTINKSNVKRIKAATS